MEEQNQSFEKVNKLPKWLTTVTPFSKYLAMFLFIVLPFIGFYLGMRYQAAITLPNIINRQEIQSFKKQSPNLSNSSSLISYKDSSGLFSFQYPNDWRIDTITIAPFTSVTKENITDVKDYSAYSVIYSVMALNSSFSLDNYKSYGEKMMGSLIKVDKQEYTYIEGIKSIRQEALYTQGNYYLAYFIPLSTTKILIMAGPDWGKNIPGISPSSGSKYVKAFESIVNSVRPL